MLVIQKQYQQYLYPKDGSDYSFHYQEMEKTTRVELVEKPGMFKKTTLLGYIYKLDII